MLFSSLFANIFTSIKDVDDPHYLINLHKFGAGEETFEKYAATSSEKMVSEVNSIGWWLFVILVIFTILKLIIESNKIE